MRIRVGSGIEFATNLWLIRAGSTAPKASNCATTRLPRRFMRCTALCNSNTVIDISRKSDCTQSRRNDIAISQRQGRLASTDAAHAPLFRPAPAEYRLTMVPQVVLQSLEHNGSHLFTITNRPILKHQRRIAQRFRRPAPQMK